MIEAKDIDVPATIRAVVGSGGVYRLLDFLDAVAPWLELDASTSDVTGSDGLSDIYVSPTLGFAAMTTGAKAGAKARVQVSLSFLVDHVVGTLVHSGQCNVLSQGYVMASESLHAQVTACANMKSLVCLRLNSNVAFCKSSNVFKRLHVLVGDDLLRLLLLQTSPFLPLPNYQYKYQWVLVCGPLPLRHPKPVPSCHLQPLATLHRRSLFQPQSHSFVPKVGLPSTHILKDPHSNQYHLFKRIFPHLHSTNTNRKRRKPWNRLRSMALPLCKAILTNAQKCDFHRLLDHHCPLSTTTTTTTTTTLAEVAMLYTPVPQVVGFLTEVLARLLPLEFWGCPHNRDTFHHHVRTFVHLARREEINNATLLTGIRIQHFAWLWGDNNNTINKKHSRSRHLAMTRQVTTLLRWIVHDLVVPLLRTNFVATTTEFSGNRILYYRKPVWALFRSLSIHHFTTTTRLYQEQTPQALTDRLQQQNHTFGCCALRLLPKKTGVRPIATLCKRDTTILTTTTTTSPRKRQRLGHYHGKNHTRQTVPKRGKQPYLPSTNEILKDAFAVVKYEHENNPNLFGTGLLGLHDFYPRWHQFVHKVSRISSPTASTPPLFFASVDIRHCYDTIDQHRLCQVIQQVFSKDNYVIHRCAMLHVLPQQGSTDSNHPRVVKKQWSQVCPAETLETFGKRTIPRATRAGSVLVDQGTSTVASKDEIMDLIHQHLNSHVVVTKARHGSIYLLQKKGIPQGGVLSSFLCNFYYGALERELFNADLQVDSTKGHVFFLVRIIDDYLLVTTDKVMHKSFLQAMRQGKPALGMNINRDKMYSSIPVSLTDSDGTCHQLEAASSEDALFPWCGMLFDTRSCEVRIDCSRFAGGRAADNLTIARGTKAGEHLRRAIKTFVRPRCIPILFDPSINCQRTIDTNFFDLMLICAVKTEAYIASSSMMDTPNKNGHFLISCIQEVILFALQLIKHRNRASLLPKSCPCTLDMTRRLAISLGWNAFYSVFRRGQYPSSFMAQIKKQLRRCSSSPRICSVVHSHLRRDQLELLGIA